MNSETAKEQSLFAEALLMADPVEREAFLEQACAGEPALRLRITKLLAAHVHSEVFFSDCIPDFVMDAGDLPDRPAPAGAGLATGEKVGRAWGGIG